MPGVYRRGKDPRRWTIKYDVEPDPITGKRRQKTTAFTGTKREAELERSRLMLEAQRGMVGMAGKLTLGDFLDRWLSDHVQPNLAPRSFMEHSGIVRNYIKPLIGHMQLEKLKPTDIIAWQAKMRGSKRMDGKGVLSTTYLKNIYATLSNALCTAVRWKVIASNPCAGITLPTPHVKNMVALSPEQAASLLESAQDEGIYWQAFFTIAVTTGLRIGEMQGLRWQDVDLHKHTLIVMQSAQRLPGRRIVARQPKTPSSRRQVALSADVITLLRKHKAAQNELRLACKEWQDLDLVFPGYSGYYVEDLKIRKTFTRILERAGLSKMRIHDLRHTAATLLLVAGINPKVVAERLGHSNVMITLQIYSHVSETMQRQAAETLDTLLKQSR